MFIKPAPLPVDLEPSVPAGTTHFKVRDPERKDYLPLEGREVPDSAYWIKLRENGDVIVSAPEQSEKPRSSKDKVKGDEK